VHHVVLERWSRRSSAVHRADPRAKIVVLLVFLVALATSRRDLLPFAIGSALVLCGAIVGARLPLVSALLRAAVVLPFSAAFAAVCWLAGDPARGLQLAAKSYLSAVAVLLLVSTTALPRLLRGLESLGVPRFLLMVAQFLYRYLFVTSGEAQHMAKAAQSRGATAAGMARREARFRAAAGALAVLFVRSYGRAGDIHRAMASRGFQGHFETLVPLRFRWADGWLAVGGSLVPLALRLAAGRFA